ncbi:hypothetical protein MTX36_29110 [Rhodococcus sp. ARC_M6]|nr:hypothetical protein [Rhodococcus sp. ARC_M6]
MREPTLFLRGGVAETHCRSRPTTGASSRRAPPPIALIITESGKREEKPLAIIVAGDLPTLTAALDAA